MGMKDPKPQFAHLVTELKKRHPDFAYIHVVEPMWAAPGTVHTPKEGESNDFLREIWAPKQYISAGGFNRENGIAAAEKSEELYAYGRWFISNVCPPPLRSSAFSDMILSARSGEEVEGGYPVDSVQLWDVLSSRECSNGLYRLPFRR